jgi:DNA-binding protein YbaB
VFDPDNFELEDFERVAQRSKEAVQRLNGVMEELGAVTGEGAAAGGLVGAVVDGGGRMQQVTLDPRIMRLDSGSIAEAVTEAVRMAQDDAQRKNEELLRTAMGEEAPALDVAGIQSWLEEAARSMGEPWPGDPR